MLPSYILLSYAILAPAHAPSGARLLASVVEGPQPSEHSSDSKVTELERQARFLYNERAYSGSARLFEQLFEETGKDAYRLYAGLAREGAGHNAHAIRHWEDYLAGDPKSAKGRKEAERSIRFAKRRTTPIRVEVLSKGASLDDVIMRFARGMCPENVGDPVVWKGDEKLGPIAVSSSDSEVLEVFETDLDPGDWCVRIEVAGFMPGVLAIQVPKSSKKVREFELELVEEDVVDSPGPDVESPGRSRLPRGNVPWVETKGGYGRPEEDRSRKVGRRLTLGLGITSGVSAGLGASLLAGGILNFRSLKHGEEVSSVSTLFGASGVSFGFALGAGVSSISAWHISHNPTRARRIWGVELAIGASAVVAGGISGYLALKGQENWTSTTLEARLTELSLAFALTGFGGSLVANSIVGLSLQGKRKRQRELSVYPVYSANLVGAGLHARF